MLWFKHDDEPSFLDYLNEYHFFYEHITTRADAEKSRIALLRALLARAAFYGVRRIVNVLLERCVCVFGGGTHTNVRADTAVNIYLLPHTHPHAQGRDCIASEPGEGERVEEDGDESEDEDGEASCSTWPPRKNCPIALAIMGGHEVSHHPSNARRFSIG